MGKLFFLRKWNDSGEEGTWSGTPYGILNALKKSLGEKNVDAVAIDYNIVERIGLKVVHGILKALSVDGCDMPDIYIEGYIANRHLKSVENEPVIVFTECDTAKIKDTYLFIDCSVDYAYRCHLNNIEFARYVPFGKRRKHSLLIERNKSAIKFYRECKGIFTMGQWLADDLVHNTDIKPEKVHCVGGGANVPQNLIDFSKKQGNKFLFVGKDFERKNGKLVLDAFAELRDKHGDQFELYIAGPGSWPLDEKVPKGVHFLGLKSTAELAEYFNLCDVFVMPSKFEAYGIVFAEALIYGLPIIGRDAFAMKDFIEHGKNGFLLKSDSKEELAELMYDAITNSDMRNYVLENNINYINQYSWESVANRILDVMQKDGYKLKKE